MARDTSSRPGQHALFTLTELAQVRVLADPLRVRILELLCDEERTTKQVADELGEKPTKLYHHVEALEKIGLIRQTRTRRNRGTLERYYLAIARRFTADPTLFDPAAGPESGETMQSVIDTVLGGTARELGQLVAAGSGDTVAESGVLSYCHVHADQKAIDRLNRRIKKLLDDLQSLDEPTAEITEGRRYRMTLAFYPLDRMGDEST